MRHAGSGKHGFHATSIGRSRLLEEGLDPVRWEIMGDLA
jgi:hypothetical protein